MTDRRNTKRLDYRVLHNTGDKVYKEEGEAFSSVSSTPTKSSEEDSAETTLDQSEDYHDVDEPFSDVLSDLSVRLENIAMGDAERVKLVSVQEALCEDIEDYIEENEFNDQSAIADIDSSITKIEEMRSKYRAVHKDIKTFDPGVYEAELKTTYEKTMTSIKNYLSTVKLIKSNIRKYESDRNSQAEKNYNAKIQEEDESKNDTSEFLLADVERLIDSLL